MAKPKFDYKVVVERVVKQEYVVTAKSEKDALKLIKQNAKSAETPLAFKSVGEVVEFGKLVRPATWPIAQVPSVEAEAA